MKHTQIGLATLLLVAAPTAHAETIDLSAPSNALREVSSYLDKACTVVHTIGKHGDTASSIGTTISTIEGLLGTGTGIGSLISDGALEVKRVLVNGKFVCTLNEMTNYAADLVDVNTWRDLGKSALYGAMNGNVRDAFGDMPQTELDKNLNTLYTSLKNNVNAFRSNVDKIANGYYSAKVAGTNPDERFGVQVALMNPGSAANLTTAVVSGSQAVKNKLNLMLQRQEQAQADKAMTGQTESSSKMSADLLGNGMPNTGTLNELDSRASKAASSRESWETLTNAITTGIRADIVYNERFGQALQAVARTTAMSNYEMSRQAEKEYDQQLANVEATQSLYGEMYATAAREMESAEDALAFSWQSANTAITPDKTALKSLVE